MFEDIYLKISAIQFFTLRNGVGSTKPERILFTCGNDISSSKKLLVSQLLQ